MPSLSGPRHWGQFSPAADVARTRQPASAARRSKDNFMREPQVAGSTRLSAFVPQPQAIGDWQLGKRGWLPWPTRIGKAGGSSCRARYTDTSAPSSLFFGVAEFARIQPG